MVSHKRTVCEKLFPKVSLRNSKIPQRILLKPRDVVCALFAGGGEKGSVTKQIRDKALRSQQYGSIFLQWANPSLREVVSVNICVDNSLITVLCLITGRSGWLERIQIIPPLHDCISFVSFVSFVLF